MDRTPVSYQLWNNYLIKNQNYNEFMEPKDKSLSKSIETISYLKREVMYAMNAIHPRLEK